MKKRLVIIGILLFLILVIQIIFYCETLARMKPNYVESYVRRINYINENVVPDILEQRRIKFERTEERIEVLNKIMKRNNRKQELEKREVIEEVYYPEPVISYNPGGHLTPSAGVYYFGNQRETYYNLPMDGVVQTAWNNGIGGDYWIREDGCKMLGNYIIVACNRNIHPYGSIVETSLGLGISLDTGGFAYDHPYGVDIAVNW